jgi:hypothetical protein
MTVVGLGGATFEGWRWEVLCILLGHRWRTERTRDVTVHAGFQPDVIFMISVPGAVTTAEFDRCGRCGLIRDVSLHQDAGPAPSSFTHEGFSISP